MFFYLVTLSDTRPQFIVESARQNWLLTGHCSTWSFEFCFVKCFVCIYVIESLNTTRSSFRHSFLLTWVFALGDWSRREKYSRQSSQNKQRMCKQPHNTDKLTFGVYYYRKNFSLRYWNKVHKVIEEEKFLSRWVYISGYFERFLKRGVVLDGKTVHNWKKSRQEWKFCL